MANTSKMAISELPEGATDAALAYQYGGNHKGGWLAYVPDKWLPYVQLTRLSPPVGLFLIYIPHTFGILHAAIRNQSTPIEVARASGLLFAGSFFNRNRPIPRGIISHLAAFLFTASQALMAALFVFAIPGHWTENALYSIPGIIGWAYYPYAKLHTFWTQAVLGFCLSWGIVMGSISLQLQPIAYKTRQIDPATLMLFIASTCWTMIYDSVYAYQDIKDDLKIGVGSMAVLFKYRIKPVFWILVAAITTCLTLLGQWEEMGPVYYIFGVGGTTTCLALMVANVNLKDSSSCWWWFSNCFWGVGGFILVGLFSEYLRPM
ncbi:hypothetical protein GQ44DRAFT_717452 [Phaeosphaeriaceae sp. PMI808]|nr:hypothetical protein GQ44DRAFT_717452 [Phaeosphaeriaceae sp. PMI808]